MKKTIKFLIHESEIEIQKCKKLCEEYKGNLELTQMYSLKILHYEFMICRLSRHLNDNTTPKVLHDIKKHHPKNKLI